MGAYPGNHKQSPVARVDRLNQSSIPNNFVSSAVKALIKVPLMVPLITIRKAAVWNEKKRLRTLGAPCL